MSAQAPNMFLKPKLKKGFRHGSVGDPFPNFSLGRHELPSICKCVFDGTSFSVNNEHDIFILNRNGSFGVSSLTNRGPSFDDPLFYKRPYFLKQLERLSSHNHNSPFLISNGSFPENCKKTESFVCSNPKFGLKKLKLDTCGAKSSNGKIDAIGSGSRLKNVQSSFCTLSNGSPNPTHLLIETKNDKNENLLSPRSFNNIQEEKLILMPEEAIFLSFGVGCLTIHSSRGDLLSYKNVWKKLVENNPDFPILYAVYHYFRAKNWVPKRGDSYGASYVLYQLGPAVHHATYIVHILGFPSRPNPTWTEIAAWLRLAGQINKNVLLCEVSLPLTFNACSSEPRSIFEMSLKETNLYRWVPNSSGQKSE